MPMGSPLELSHDCVFRSSCIKTRQSTQETCVLLEERDLYIPKGPLSSINGQLGLETQRDKLFEVDIGFFAPV